MSFEYRTEYGLGRRGRVCRSYSGVQAIIAITFDLALGFTFGLLDLGVWLARWCLVAAYRIAVALVSLPLQAARAITFARPGRAAAKPAWACFDEL